MPLTQISPKRVVAGLVALAGILALAACGGGAEGTPTPFSLGGGSQVSGFTPTPTASTEGVTPEAPTATPAETVSPGPSPTAPNGGGASLPIASIGNELRFDTGELTASAGSQVRVAFQNNATSAALEHNWVLIEAGTEDAVAAAGLTAGAGNDWIPKDDPNVIAFVPLIDGGASGEVSFPAPPPGTYAYICSFPGHSGTMRGVFEVAS